MIFLLCLAASILRWVIMSSCLLSSVTHSLFSSQKADFMALVMVNFTCQLDWAMECPDIWSDISLGVSVRVCPDEIIIGISRLSKSDTSFPPDKWAPSSQFKP